MHKRERTFEGGKMKKLLRQMSGSHQSDHPPNLYLHLPCPPLILYFIQSSVSLCNPVCYCVELGSKQGLRADLHNRPCFLSTSCPLIITTSSPSCLPSMTVERKKEVQKESVSASLSSYGHHSLSSECIYKKMSL